MKYTFRRKGIIEKNDCPPLQTLNLFFALKTEIILKKKSLMYREKTKLRKGRIFRRNKMKNRIYVILQPSIQIKWKRCSFLKKK